jgi:hypothetical protein
MRWLFGQEGPVRGDPFHLRVGRASGYPRSVTAPRTISSPRCNIGSAEIARRRRIAIVLSAATLLLAAALLASGATHVVRLGLWPFAAGAAVTWLQVVRRFCVRFGAMGVENFGRLGEEHEVDRTIRAADARRAAAMIAEGALIGLVATLAIVALPR